MDAPFEELSTNALLGEDAGVKQAALREAAGVLLRNKDSPMRELLNRLATVPNSPLPPPFPLCDVPIQEAVSREKKFVQHIK